MIDIHAFWIYFLGMAGGVFAIGKIMQRVERTKRISSPAAGSLTDSMLSQPPEKTK